MLRCGRRGRRSCGGRRDDGSGGGKNGDLALWAARGDKVDDEDIVVWHSVSLTHNPRPEDYPVMPCETMTVSLKPSGFFEYNPAEGFDLIFDYT